MSGNTRPPGFYLPRAFSREPYLYHPVFKVCVCVALKKTVLRRVFLCLISENSLIFPAPSVGNHICAIQYSKCVCASHLKDSITLSVLVTDFREQFMPIGSVLSFSENS